MWLFARVQREGDTLSINVKRLYCRKKSVSNLQTTKLYHFLHAQKPAFSMGDHTLLWWPVNKPKRSSTSLSPSCAARRPSWGTQVCGSWGLENTPTVIAKPWSSQPNMQHLLKNLLWVRHGRHIPSSSLQDITRVDSKLSSSVTFFTTCFWHTASIKVKRYPSLDSRSERTRNASSIHKHPNDTHPNPHIPSKPSLWTRTTSEPSMDYNTLEPSHSGA